MSRKPTRQKNMFLFPLLFALVVTVLSGALAFSKYVTGDALNLSLNISGTKVSYTVKHYYEKVGADVETYDANNYELKSEDKVWSVYNRKETPAVKPLDGFAVPTAQTITVDDSNNQVVEYYYPRESYLLTLNKDEDVESVTDSASANWPTDDNKPYVTVSGKAGAEIATLYTTYGTRREFYKTNEGEAYCVLASRYHTSDIEQIGILLISKDVNAVSYYFKDYNVNTNEVIIYQPTFNPTTKSGTIEHENETWYYWGTDYQFPEANIKVEETKAGIPYLNEMTNAATMLNAESGWKNSYKNLAAAAEDFLKLYYANQDNSCANFYEFEEEFTVTATFTGDSAEPEVDTGNDTEGDTGESAVATPAKRLPKWLCWGGTFHTLGTEGIFTMPAKDVSMVAMTDNDLVRVVDKENEVLMQLEFVAADGTVNNRTFTKVTNDRAYFTTLHRDSKEFPWYSIGLVSEFADGVKYATSGSHTRTKFGPEGLFVLNDTVYYYSGNLFSMKTLRPDEENQSSDITKNVYPIPYWADWPSSGVGYTYTDPNSGTEIPVYSYSDVVFREIVNYMYQGGDSRDNDVQPSFIFRFAGNDTHYTEVGEGNVGWTRGQPFVLKYLTSDSSQYVLPEDKTVGEITDIVIDITYATDGTKRYYAANENWFVTSGSATAKTQSVTVTIPAQYLDGAISAATGIRYAS